MTVTVVVRFPFSGSIRRLRNGFSITITAGGGGGGNYYCVAGAEESRRRQRMIMWTTTTGDDVDESGIDTTPVVD